MSARLLACVLAIGVPLVLPRPCSAQGGGGGKVTGVSVLRTNDLLFGTVVAGLDAQVLPGDATAGTFEVRAPQDASVTLTFTLPVALVAGSNVLPIEFGANAAAWSDRNRFGTSTAFDPVQGVTVTVPPSKTLYIWLGGRLLPPVSQPAGSYATTITLTATLN